jgi:hypothetical protein
MTLVNGQSGQNGQQGQMLTPPPSINEVAAKGLAMQLAQTALDKAFVEARLEVLLQAVQGVLSTTQWTTSDDGVISAVVATQPFQQLQALVLGPDAQVQYSPHQ